MTPNHFEIYENYIPLDLAVPSHFIYASLVITAIVAFRYFLVAGIFWLSFYVFPFNWHRRRQIYKKLPSRSAQLNEIKWSVLSCGIFGVTGAFMGLMWQWGWLKLYLKFDEYPLWWFPVSLFLLSFLHDAYFYFTHRLMHWPIFYRRIHAVHHASVTPSPWASFSFHPLESLIEALPVPLLLCLIPMHPMAVIFYLTMMTLSAIINHLGFEILPEGSEDHWLGCCLISGVHHSLHHKNFTTNFALFYTWLDHLFGTQDPTYEVEFRRVWEPK